MIHINAISKNTADDKIRQALRRFAAEHPAPATVILISGLFISYTSVTLDLGIYYQYYVPSNTVFELNEDTVY